LVAKKKTKLLHSILQQAMLPTANPRVNYTEKNNGILKTFLNHGISKIVNTRPRLNPQNSFRGEVID
jgi:hypothetical protein